jgi:hypothetical protein
MDHKLLRPLYDLAFLFLFSLGGREFQQSCIGEIRVCCLAMVSVVWLECQIDTELLLPRFALDQMLTNLLLPRFALDQMLTNLLCCSQIDSVGLCFVEAYKGYL